MTHTHHLVLTVSCPDQPGLIARFTGLVAEHQGNILDLSQHTATDIGQFFLKADFTLAEENLTALASTVGKLSENKDVDCQLHNREQKPNVAIFVSKTDHCLVELLLKQRDDELSCRFACIVSNHPDLKVLASQFDIPFHLVENDLDKAQREKKIRQLLSDASVDFLILARYMQILSAPFVASWENRILNIHHGLLPAFKGARPYHQAWEKGVKLIGATAHYATADLDMGPIIHQDIRLTNDRMSVSDLVKLGKDVERTVLVRALQLHLEHRVFVKNERTFVL